MGGGGGVDENNMCRQAVLPFNLSGFALKRAYLISGILKLDQIIFFDFFIQDEDMNDQY